MMMMMININSRGVGGVFGRLSSPIGPDMFFSHSATHFLIRRIEYNPITQVSEKGRVSTIQSKKKQK